MVERDDDENPGVFFFRLLKVITDFGCLLDIIPGLDPTSPIVLGQAIRRDPDALPPRNVLEKTINWMYHVVTGIGGGNVLFALKAGILTSETYSPLIPVGGFGY